MGCTQADLKLLYFLLSKLQLKSHLAEVMFVIFSKTGPSHDAKGTNGSMLLK